MPFAHIQVCKYGTAFLGCREGFGQAFNGLAPSELGQIGFRVENDAQARSVLDLVSACC